MPHRRRQLRQSGATSIQILAILVPVLFAFMGFAIDLGRLYMARGELQTAANAMALAAASRLFGTDQSATDAGRQAELALAETGGLANRYDFGGNRIGQTNGNLESQAFDPEFYDSAAAAISGEGNATGGSTARYVRIRLRAEAPLVFFSFLPIAAERKTPIEVEAVAGQSAPLCTACGIEPIVIQAADATDTTHFGFLPATTYTLGYQCNGGPAPGLLTNTSGRINYLLLNRYNEEATLYPEEGQQAFRQGAGGMPASTVPARSCVTVGADETLWVNAAPTPCAQNRVAPPVAAFACGLAARFDFTLQTACQNITDIDTLAGLYQPDSDVSDVADYAQYAGSGRRLITVAVVEALNPGGAMQALGFREFLLQPNADSSSTNAGDGNARVRVTYLGSVAPLKQGRFDGCTQTAGPGKVVLHR